ncbi:MAG: HEPN domain-containing protein [Firmicutes bacterium]|jgi:HEPN domain-containing protein|nr:HEPN domain-containing protein [Bacillota bacterium]
MSDAEAKAILVGEWMKKADDDLGVAELTLEHGPRYIDAICFHSQQAVEKYLKGYLTYLDVRFRKSHSLGYLLDLLAEREQVPNETYEMADKLEDYAVEVRYPDAGSDQKPTLDEAREAVEIARRFRGMVLEKMQPGDHHR